ncbi:C4-dicarboxylate TRAP transporter substrate-binding protein [Castellaniella sp.]|uniref:C4-dicarboxylate TRAP transporter substrate-binding protein n=1 Tax=Castellaniella sp. TaxID=1955812 RepID=UPI002AFFF47E|nr:C4-dicarboxylate TRAP transporter substrate-binding protein [Castellaniella sp.]
MKLSSLVKSILAVGTLAIGLTSPAFAQDPVTLKVAYENHPGEPLDKVMHHWADLLKDRSQGQILLELYPSSQLGAKNDVMEQAMMGMNVITLSDVAFLADYEPDLGVLFGPYLSSDPDKLFKIYESDWFKSKEEALKKKGVHLVMTNYLYGVRQLLAKKPVLTPDDLKGMKVRVPSNVMQIKTFEAMGASPTPMPLGDVYPALTQGMIDGVENPISVLYGQKLHEQAKYLSMISYITNTSVWVGGEAFFSTLDPAVVKMIHETGYEAGLYSQKVAMQEDERLIEQMKAAGVEVIYPDVAPFREKALQVYGQFPEWSPNLYETIQEQLK